jgi:hypothetical protein
MSRLQIGPRAEPRVPSSAYGDLGARAAGISIKSEHDPSIAAMGQGRLRPRLLPRQRCRILGKQVPQRIAARQCVVSAVNVAGFLVGIVGSSHHGIPFASNRRACAWDMAGSVSHQKSG